ncbi:MAG: FtsX-like permease family protein [Deltaproteobacteria bacterium]|nr:FtsX-like permease family protein [Deltaproteobacteria bacterium]
MGVGALVFFVGLGLGLSRVLREEVFPVDARRVEVVPPPVSLGGLLAPAKLDADTVARLSALPGVTAAYRKLVVQVPAACWYDGEFFGHRLRAGFDVYMVGVEPALVRKDVAPGEFSDAGPGEPVPVLASTRLLEIYNKSFAPTRKLPRLGKDMLAGFEFPVQLGRSFMARTEDSVQQVRARVVGFSPAAPLEGVAVPLATAERLHRERGVGTDAFTSVVLVAEDPGAVPAIAEGIREMGLQLDEREKSAAEAAGGAVAVVTAALSLLSLLVCALAAFNIAHASTAAVRAREQEIGVLRAVGATRAAVRALFLGEAAVVGLGGGGLGTAAAVGLARAADLAASRGLPAFPFKPESFFLLPWPLLAGGVLLGAAAAVAGAWIPSRAAAAVDPARTLAG